ncbi:hypothetical protein [Streptomyces seoulensis]|uniref:hypothetical protein n=1 Tax=Streptomyces seoulensis TaxID=73044 RepID=UPI001FCA629D|nr:hypothetical protein [Streptomyces seoulensis]BDH04859.1 hypothetical protein HEK131_20860 [Streptomyces seoulensis]
MSDTPMTSEQMQARLAELESQRAALAVRLRAGQKWQQGRTPPLVTQDYVGQDELRAIFDIALTPPWEASAEDPCHPCGCPKRFNGHAWGCPTADGITRRIAPTQALAEDAAREVAALTAQMALTSEFRVPLPAGVGGGYGEIVVRREAADSDRWAVTDGALTGLRAWRDPDGWQYVSEIGRAEAFVYSLDEALDIAEEVAEIEGELHAKRIAAHGKGGEQR